MTPIAPDLAIVVFGVATLGWTVLPILGFGNDETLDPQRLATLPLSRRQLVSGVLAASLVGVAPLATLVALSGALRRPRAHPGVRRADRAGGRGDPALVRGRVAHARRAARADPAIAPRSRLHDPRDNAARAHAAAPRAVRGSRLTRSRLSSGRRADRRPRAATPRSPGAAPRHRTPRAGTISRRSDSSPRSAALIARAALGLGARPRTRAHEPRRTGRGARGRHEESRPGSSPGPCRSSRTTASARPQPRTCGTSHAIRAGGLR